VEGKIKFRGTEKVYFLDNKEVTEQEFNEAIKPTGLQEGYEGLVGFKPVHSETLGVHPKQIKEATEDAAKKGVPTRFDRVGRPVFVSSRHFREYAKAYGYRHKGY
jgi:hypothetical protein